MKEKRFIDSEAYRLHEVVYLFDAIAASLLKPFRVTYNEFLVLMAAREASRSTHQEIAAMLNWSKSLLSQRVRSLAAKALVTRRINDDNRREVYVDLTSHGSAELRKMYGALVDASEAIFAALGKQRSAFYGGLTILSRELVREATRAHTNASGAANAEGARTGTRSNAESKERTGR